MSMEAPVLHRMDPQASRNLNGLTAAGASNALVVSTLTVLRGGGVGNRLRPQTSSTARPSACSRVLLVLPGQPISTFAGRPLRRTIDQVLDGRHDIRRQWTFPQGRGILLDLRGVAEARDGQGARRFGEQPCDGALRS